MAGVWRRPWGRGAIYADDIGLTRPSSEDYGFDTDVSAIRAVNRGGIVCPMVAVNSSFDARAELWIIRLPVRPVGTTLPNR